VQYSLCAERKTELWQRQMLYLGSQPLGQAEEQKNDTGTKQQSSMAQGWHVVHWMHYAKRCIGNTLP